MELPDNFNCMQSTAAMKEFKELRSLCLKIISLVLNKYADHELGCKFWDFFFNSVRPLIDGFKQEGASSEKPSSLFSCFLCMTGSYKLISLLYREANLVPNILSILTVPTASEDILSCVLNFVENLLNLDSELDPEDDAIERILLPSLDALICGLHCLFKFNNVARRYETIFSKSITYGLVQNIPFWQTKAFVKLFVFVSLNFLA